MDAQATSWIAFGIAAVTMIGGCVKAMIDSRDKRINSDQAVKVAHMQDTIEFNQKELMRSSDKIATLEKSHADCLEHHAETTEALLRCKDDHVENARRLSALEAIVSPDPDKRLDEIP